MQKALYFCFAFWAGFVMKGKEDYQISQKENQFLFDEHFEAWSCGPVVPNVKLFRSTEEEKQRKRLIPYYMMFLKQVILN